MTKQLIISKWFTGETDEPEVLHEFRIRERDDEYEATEMFKHEANHLLVEGWTLIYINNPLSYQFINKEGRALALYMYEPIKL